MLATPIQRRSIARLGGAPVPIARFGGIGVHARADLETARIQKHAEGVILFCAVAKKADRFLRARGLVLSEIGLVAREVEHAEVADGIEIVQLRRGAVLAKGGGVILRDADPLVITISQLIHRPRILRGRRFLQETDRFAFVFVDPFAEEITFRQERPRAPVARLARLREPLRRLHKITLHPGPIRVAQTDFRHGVGPPCGGGGAEPIEGRLRVPLAQDIAQNFHRADDVELGRGVERLAHDGEIIFGKGRFFRLHFAQEQLEAHPTHIALRKILLQLHVSHDRAWPVLVGFVFFRRRERVARELRTFA